MVALASSIGCAAVPRAASPSGSTSIRVTNETAQTEALIPEASQLDPHLLVEYEHERISIQPGQKAGVVLFRDGETLSERDFRKSYRSVVGSDDLDQDAWRRARRSNATVVAAASGFTVLGVGGFVILGVSKQPARNPNFGKALVGSAIYAGAGLYVLGCEVVKGARCILDGNVGVRAANLSPEGASHFVEQYNAALLRSIEHRNVAPQDAPRSAKASTP
jgi:hypothetical protein